MLTLHFEHRAGVSLHIGACTSFMIVILLYLVLLFFFVASSGGSEWHASGVGIFILALNRLDFNASMGCGACYSLMIVIS